MATNNSRIALYVLLLVILVSHQTVSQETEEICGTWENGDYLATGGSSEQDPFIEVQRLLILPIGEMELSRIEEGFLERKASYTITSKRIDADGNTVYEQILSWYFDYAGKRQEVGRFYILAKVDRAGETLELVSDTVDFPTTIDPDHTSYRIYYRQK